MDWVEADLDSNGYCGLEKCPADGKCVRPIEFLEPQLCVPKWFAMKGGLESLWELNAIWFYVYLMLGLLLLLLFFELIRFGGWVIQKRKRVGPKRTDQIELITCATLDSQA